MEKLTDEIRQCTKCELAESCTQKVIGKGVANPKFLFIGEAPGKQEDETGTPFCGPSGEMLDTWRNFLDCTEDSAVINVLKCRPPKNADPTPEQVEVCRPWLNKQIELLNPEYIVVVGRFAMKEILGDDSGITKKAGKIFEQDGRKVIVMPHPSFYLRRGGNGWQLPLLRIKEQLYIAQASRHDGDEFGIFDQGEPSKESKEGSAESKKVDDFVLTHVHTTHSKGDAVGKVSDFVAYAKKCGHWALAVTDHGVMAGTYDFQNRCKENDIKPLIGCEYYIAPDYESKTRYREHLVLLAKNEVGLRNLFKLDTMAHVDGFYYKQRITLEDILKHKEGLIATSACTLGILSHKIVDGYENGVTFPRYFFNPDNKRLVGGKMIGADDICDLMQGEFGDDFYVELQYHRFDQQQLTNPILIRMAKERGIKLIITSDTHYITEDDYETHKVRRAIEYHSHVNDPKVALSSNTHFIPTKEEAFDMAVKAGIPEDIIKEAFKNTVEIAEKCNALIEKEEDAIPKFKQELIKC